MKVLRKCEVDTPVVQVGDQITVSLDEIGTFTATAQQCSPEWTLFMFDDNLVCMPVMNKPCGAKYNYDTSDLRRWIGTELLNAFPEDIRCHIYGLDIPSYGQLFGHEDEPLWVTDHDNDEQLPLMKNRKNRISGGCISDWYWLRNKAKRDDFETYFGSVNDFGTADYTNGSDYALGVRPVFYMNTAK